MHGVEPESSNSAQTMSFALSQIPSSASLHTGLVGTDGGNSGGRPTESRKRTTATEDAHAIEKDNPQRERISLSTLQDAASIAYIPAAPYAEIWKNGRKVAEVDSRGEVNVLEGVVAAHASFGTGLASAAQKAVMIARTIGGEIRVAGRPTDVPTLAMSARLSEAYR